MMRMRMRTIGLTLVVLLVTGSAAQAWYPYNQRYREWQAKRPFMMGGLHNGLPMDRLPERVARFKAAGLNTLIGHEFHTWHFFEAAREAGLEWATWNPAERSASPNWRWGHDGSTAYEVIARAIRQTPGCSFIQTCDGPKTEEHMNNIAAFSKWLDREFPGILSVTCLSIAKIDHDRYVKKARPDVFAYYTSYSALNVPLMTCSSCTP